MYICIVIDRLTSELLFCMIFVLDSLLVVVAKWFLW